jgi:hypothetical protein
MPDTERRKSTTSLRHGRHELRTTGHVTSEKKSNSEEDRRKEEIAQKEMNYMTSISWRYGRTVQLSWCLSHVYQFLSLPFHEAGRILEQKLLLHHLMATSALIKHQITRPYGYFCTLHATKLDTCSFHLFLHNKRQPTTTSLQRHSWQADICCASPLTTKWYLS